jgi:hypothetical protein
MGFDKETGILPNSKKRFSGMPFIGNDYGKFSPKILIVGEDIGSDECVKKKHKRYQRYTIVLSRFSLKARELC